MKHIFTFILLLALGMGCKPKVISGVELQNKLKETIDEYLHKTLQPGTIVVVKDVIYYPERMKRVYICQFHVNMRFGNGDTTGVVEATISNDFSKVIRTR